MYKLNFTWIAVYMLQAFFRTGGLARIEDLRDEKVSGFVVDLQAICRGYLGRQKLVKLKVSTKQLLIYYYSKLLERKYFPLYKKVVHQWV